MVRKTIRLLVLGVLLAVLPAIHAGALEPYCCLCTACTTGAPVQCAPVMAPGTFTADCAAVCSRIGCGSSRVIDGFCPAPDACAGLVAPAPALSWQALFGLALALAVDGVYRAQRRLRT
jgi:hypothetical protein